MAKKPNIILIFPDQHRGDTMDCTGNPVVRTPNLDRLAAEGATFTRCCTNSPLCMPARASLISGQYVNEHGVWNNSIVADRHGPSHVRNVRDAGYHTMVIGKTHLYLHQGAGHTDKHVQKLRDWGYEDSHEITGPLASIATDSPYTDYLNEKHLLNVHREHLRTYARGVVRRYLHPWETPPCLLPTEDHMDMYIARKSVEWIQSYQGNKPFYLQVCFPGPHDPFDSPAEYRAMYRPEDMPPAIMERPKEPVSPLVKQFLQLSHLEDMTEIHSRIIKTYYYAKVTLIDEGIGHIVKALKEKGWLDNTWILYTSDHGEMLGDHRLNHKMAFYESALNIPCIIRPPRGTKGWKSNALTDQIDVAASILDIAGAKTLDGSDGRSLVSQVKAGPGSPDAQKGKEAIFSEIMGHSMVRNERYKMAVNSRTRQTVELYDMVNDPLELRNLAKDPSMEKVRRDLLERYLTHLLSHLDSDKLKVYEGMAGTI
jgi:choline-sulfatase